MKKKIKNVIGGLLKYKDGGPVNPLDPTSQMANTLTPKQFNNQFGKKTSAPRSKYMPVVTDKHGSVTTESLTHKGDPQVAKQLLETYGILPEQEATRKSYSNFLADRIAPFGTYDVKQAWKDITGPAKNPDKALEQLLAIDKEYETIAEGAYFDDEELAWKYPNGGSYEEYEKRKEDLDKRSEEALNRFIDSPPGEHNDLLRTTLGLKPKYNTLDISDYKPSLSKDKDQIYYKLKGVTSPEKLLGVYDAMQKGNNKPLVFASDEMNKVLSEDQDLAKKINEIAYGKNFSDEPIKDFDYSKEFPRSLGKFTITKGKDDKGEYISYYDKWDLAPSDVNVDAIVGKPLEVYDRFYLNDYETKDGKMFKKGTLTPISNLEQQDMKKIKKFEWGGLDPALKAFTAAAPIAGSLAPKGPQGPSTAAKIGSGMMAAAPLLAATGIGAIPAAAMAGIGLGLSFIKKKDTTAKFNGTPGTYATGGDMQLSSNSFQVQGNPNITDGNQYQMQGQQVALDHNEVVTDTPQGKFVYSDKIKDPQARKTFAKMAEKVERATGKAEKKLKVNPYDPAAKATVAQNKILMDGLAERQEFIANALGMRNRPQDQEVQQQVPGYYGGGLFQQSPQGGPVQPPAYDPKMTGDWYYNNDAYTSDPTKAFLPKEGQSFQSTNSLQIYYDPSTGQYLDRHLGTGKYAPIQYNGQQAMATGWKPGPSFANGTGPINPNASTAATWDKFATGQTFDAAGQPIPQAPIAQPTQTRSATGATVAAANGQPVRATAASGSRATSAARPSATVPAALARPASPYLNMAGVPQPGTGTTTTSTGTAVNGYVIPRGLNVGQFQNWWNSTDFVQNQGYPALGTDEKYGKDTDEIYRMAGNLYDSELKRKNDPYYVQTTDPKTQAQYKANVERDGKSRLEYDAAGNPEISSKGTSVTDELGPDPNAAMLAKKAEDQRIAASTSILNPTEASDKSEYEQANYGVEDPTLFKESTQAYADGKLNEFMTGKNADGSAKGPDTYKTPWTTGDYFKVAELLSKSIGAFSKPEVEKPLLDTTRISQQVYDPSNALYQTDRQQRNFLNTSAATAPTAGLRRAMQGSSLATSIAQKNQVLSQYQQMNQQGKAQYEDRVSQQSRFNLASQGRTNEMNAQNRAAKDMVQQNFFTSLGQFGEDLNRKRTAEDMMTMLQVQYPEIFNSVTSQISAKRKRYGRK